MASSIPLIRSISKLDEKLAATTAMVFETPADQRTPKEGREVIKGFHRGQNLLFGFIGDPGVVVEGPADGGVGHTGMTGYVVNGDFFRHDRSNKFRIADTIFRIKAHGRPVNLRLSRCTCRAILDPFNEILYTLAS
jgi:hypothetical protein